jgi:hypothetical protein
MGRDLSLNIKKAKHSLIKSILTFKPSLALIIFFDYFTKVKSAFMRNIVKYRVTLLILTLITLCGYFIRAKFAFDSPYITYFSSDDFGHSFRSGINQDGACSFTHLMHFSYVDAHPIFRNIVLNMILRITNNVYDFRLVSMIPGILLIPLAFFFTKIICLNMDDKPRHSNLIALIISCFYAFSFLPINLSIGTRPYTLMLLFQICSLISFLSFNRSKNTCLLILFYFFCALAIITDYSALIPIGTLAFASIVLTWNKRLQIKHKNIVIAGSILLLSITGFQFYNMHTRSTTESTILERNVNLTYIAGPYITNFEGFRISLFKTFRSFFITTEHRANVEVFTFAMEFLYFTGLIYLIFRRSYLLLFLALFPMIFGATLSYLKLFPFNGGRHSVYFFSSILISYIGVFSFLLNQKKWLITKFLFAMIVIGFFNCSGIYKSSTGYLKLVSSIKNHFIPTPLEESTLMDIIDLIIDKKYENYYIVLPHNLERHLNIFLNFSKFKKKDTQPDFFELLKNKLSKLKDKDSILYNSGNNHVKFMGDNSLSGRNFNKTLVISLSSVFHEVVLKSIQDKGFTKSIIKVTHKDWIYDELQIN